MRDKANRAARAFGRAGAAVWRKVVAVDPLDLAGPAGLALVCAGVGELAGRAWAAIVGGGALVVVYVYVEVALPSRIIRRD